MFVVKNNPTFETNFVFATLMPVSDNNLNNSQQSIGTVYQQKNTGKKKIDGVSSKRSAREVVPQNTSVTGVYFKIICTNTIEVYNNIDKELFANKRR